MFLAFNSSRDFEVQCTSEERQSKDSAMFHSSEASENLLNNTSIVQILSDGKQLTLPVDFNDYVSPGSISLNPNQMEFLGLTEKKTVSVSLMTNCPESHLVKKAELVFSRHSKESSEPISSDLFMKIHCGFRWAVSSIPMTKPLVLNKDHIVTISIDDELYDVLIKQIWHQNGEPIPSYGISMNGLLSWKFSTLEH